MTYVQGLGIGLICYITFFSLVSMLFYFTGINKWEAIGWTWKVSTCAVLIVGVCYSLVWAFGLQ